MQQSFTEVFYKRRLALEKIELAMGGEGLETELGAILIELAA